MLGSTILFIMNPTPSVKIHLLKRNWCISKSKMKTILALNLFYQMSGCINQWAKKLMQIGLSESISCNNLQTLFCKSAIKSPFALQDHKFTYSKSILENYERFLKDFSFSLLCSLSQLCSSFFLEDRSKIARHLISSQSFCLFLLEKPKQPFCVFASIF